MTWELEPGGTSDLACECCGNSTRTVDGFLHEDGATRAAYLVQWTADAGPDHGANFDLILGAWGPRAGASERFVVSLVYYNDSGFTVIDAAERPAASSELATRGLSREDVIGTELATAVFEMIDVVWTQDPRIAHLVAAHQGEHSA